MSRRVTVHEVAPRDGLQNENEIVSTDDKLEFISKLVSAGYSDIEVTSFVRPRWVPQLADAGELIRRLPRHDDVRYWALVPNRKGLERALDAGLGAVATFLSASEAHNKKDLNRTIGESLAAQREVIATARAEKLEVRAYISTVFGCPYEGEVDPAAVVRVASELLDAGAGILSLGDTTGMAHPHKVDTVLEALSRAGIPFEHLALHMHDTRGTALVNVFAGLLAGVRIFDGSVAGLGGCPYAPGASGNLASEDLIYMLDGMGYDTGIDLDAAADAGHFIEDVLGHELPGRYHRCDRGGRARVSTATADEESSIENPRAATA